MVKNNENSDLNKSIINKAFSTNKDFITDVVDFDKNISYIVNVDEIYPSKQETLDKVFNEVFSDFINTKKINFAIEKYEVSKVDNNLEKIEKIFGVNIDTIQDITDR